MKSVFTRRTARLGVAGLVVVTSLCMGSNAMAAGKAFVAGNALAVDTAEPGSCAAGGACKVGDPGPGEGIVFFDAGTKQSWGRYLEVAPASWSGAASEPVATWCAEGKDGFTATVRTGTDIGSGAGNTKAIVKACGSTSAAGVAAAYRGGGKADWYLPSKDEVNTLFRKRSAVGSIPAKSLWSSSQSSHYATYAWGQLLVSEGRYIGSYKGYGGMVRPIRAF
jgi:hypothetical protein